MSFLDDLNAGSTPSLPASTTTEEMGKAFKQGLFGVAPTMLGQAIKGFAPVWSKAYKAGQGLQTDGEAISMLPGLQREGYDDRGEIAKIAISGAGAVGQMVPTVAASMINPILGAGVAASEYGGSTYQDTKERMLAQEGLDDAFAAANPNDPRIQKINATAIGTGAVQGLGEGAMAYVGGKFLKGAPLLGKAGEKLYGTSGLRRFGVDTVIKAAGEGVTEPLQDEAQAALERSAGLKDAPGFMDQAAESARGGFGASLLMAPLGMPGHVSEAHQRKLAAAAAADPTESAVPPVVSPAVEGIPAGPPNAGQQGVSTPTLGDLIGRNPDGTIQVSGALTAALATIGDSPASEFAAPAADAEAQAKAAQAHTDATPEIANKISTQDAALAQAEAATAKITAAATARINELQSAPAELGQGEAKAAEIAAEKAKIVSAQENVAVARHKRDLAARDLADHVDAGPALSSNPGPYAGMYSGQMPEAPFEQPGQPSAGRNVSSLLGALPNTQVPNTALPQGATTSEVSNVQQAVGRSQEEMPAVRGNAEVAGTTQVLAEYSSQEVGLVARVAKIDSGFSVTHQDIDSGEVLSQGKIFKTQDEADSFAQSSIKYIAPSAAQDGISAPPAVASSPTIDDISKMFDDAAPTPATTPALGYPKLQAKAKQHGLKMSPKQADGSFSIGEQAFPNLRAVQSHIESLGTPAPVAKVAAAKPAAQPKPAAARNFLQDIKKNGKLLHASIKNFLSPEDMQGPKGKGNIFWPLQSKSGLGMDTMASGMRDLGWQIPTDHNNEPDAQAFAHMVRDAFTGNRTPTHPDDVERQIAEDQAAEAEAMAAEFKELSTQEIQEDIDNAENYDESESGTPFDFSAFDDFLKEITSETPAGETETVSGQDKANIQQDTPVVTTDDAGGLKQQVALEGDRKNPTIGGVQKQGGKAVGTSDFLDGFTPDPEQDLFAAPKAAAPKAESAPAAEKADSPIVQRLLEIQETMGRVFTGSEAGAMDRSISKEIYDELKRYDSTLAYNLMKKGEEGIQAGLMWNGAPKSNKAIIYQAQVKDFRGTLDRAIAALRKEYKGSDMYAAPASVPTIDDISAMFDEAVVPETAPAAEKISFADDRKYDDSARGIAKREEARIRPLVIQAMEQGARLSLHRKVKKYATEGLDPKNELNGISVPPSLVKKMADEGLLKWIGEGLYSAGDKAPAPSIATAAAHVGNAFDAGMAALKALGANITDPTKFGTGIGPDDKVYQQMKPHLTAMWFEAKVAAADITAAFKEFIAKVMKAFGTDAPKFKPFVMRFAQEVLNGDIIEETTQGADNVLSSGSNLEPNSGEGKTADGVGSQDVQSGSGRPDGRTGVGVRPDGNAGGNVVSGTTGVPYSETAFTGEYSDQPVRSGPGSGRLTDSATGSMLGERSGDTGVDGSPVDAVAAKAVVKAAARILDLKEKQAAQLAAQSVKVISGDLANIEQSVPFLLPGQRDDVKFAEDRFAKPDGYGVLFTNGTGTGKTYTGLGIIKRLERQGKKNILIVSPSKPINEAWVKSGRDLHLEITALNDTKDAGKGIVITTYANFRDNAGLVNRNWDAIVFDEAQNINSNAAGEKTRSHAAMHGLTLHPDGVHARARMKAPDLWTASEEISKQIDALTGPNNEAVYNRLATERTALLKQQQVIVEATQAEVTAAQGTSKRPRTVFLSATPFAYMESVQYGNGYLFDWNEGQEEESGRGYNSGSNHQRFMMRHFGYAMRTGKLNKPGHNIDQGVMQRQFNSWLKSQGVLSGRMLDSDYDYDRKFVLIDSGIGRTIDDGLSWLREHSRMAAVEELVRERFDYLSRRYLLEAIKAREAIPVIKEHIAMGRKVVVFHDYNRGGGTNPFDVSEWQHSTKRVSFPGADGKRDSEDLGILVREFMAARPDLVALPFNSYKSAVEEMKAAFPGLMQVNGPTASKQRSKNITDFQTDSNGQDVILVQADAGGAGISLHDTTGVHARVLINLGMPTKPVTAIQQEGRIYRVGQASNAMFRYFNTGTNWERFAFATAIAVKTSGAENLAAGESARAMMDAFVDGFQESGSYKPGHEGEGTGGKERDRMANSALTEYDKARTHYWASKKGRQNNIGADFFATPEPVGFKMSEWADVADGEAVLEPSGGKAAIARYFNPLAKRDMIEPSFELVSSASLVFDGKIIQGSFEDHHVGGNKYDAIVMNPPFGSAGKTAMDHLEKAAKHLKSGGRIVALIPSGPSMDKRLDKWMAGEEIEKVPAAGTVNGQDVYVGDQIDFRPEATSAAAMAGTGTITRIVKRDGKVAIVFYKNTKGSASTHDYNIHSIDPTGPRERKITNEMTLVADIKLPSVTFERAGTKVNTHIVILDKNSDSTASVINRDYTDMDTTNDLFDRIEGLDIPKRSRTEKEAATTQENAATASAPESGPTDAPSNVQGLHLENITHTKTGAALFSAKMTDKVSSAEYKVVADMVKANGGMWSRFTKSFLFNKESGRDGFVAAYENAGIEYSTGTGAGIQASDITAAIAPVLKLSKTGIDVYQSASDVPGHIRADFSKRGLDANAFFDHSTGRIGLIADHIASMERVKELLRHEWFHAGVANKELTALYNYFARNDLAALEQIAKERGFKLSTEEGLLQAAGEYAAQIAETQPKNMLLGRIVAQIKAWLRALGMNIELDKGGVAYIIRKAINRVGWEKGESIDYHAAYHGSPHDHNQFSTDHIGTGEGVQAYGWGLYFAGKKEVAEHYRDVLSSDPMRIPFKEILSKVFPERQFSMSESSDIFAGVLQKDVTGKVLQHRNVSLRDVEAKRLDEVISKSLSASKGKLYTVELLPEESDYLDWDKPLSQQSKKVTTVLKKAGPIIDAKFKEYLLGNDVDGRQLYNIVSKSVGGGLDEQGRQKAASEYLYSLGIPGIKYLDGTSRWSEGATDDHNYVIFNHDDVEIIAKYSAGGTVAAAKDFFAKTSSADIAKGLGKMAMPDNMVKSAAAAWPKSMSALNYLFSTPVFHAERDARKRKDGEIGVKDFTDAGISRAENNMETQLDLMGYDGPSGVKPTLLQRAKEGLTTWESSDTTTEWGRVEKEVRSKLAPEQQAAVDILQREGDVNNKVYETLADAMKNSRVAAAKPTQAAFDAYKRVRDFIDGPMAEARERQIIRLGEVTGTDKKLVANTIKAYRAHLGTLKGWMPRKHGEGSHQVNVYHTIKALPFVGKAIEAGHIASLPFYAGTAVAKEIRAFAKANMLLVHRSATGGPIVIASDATADKIAAKIDALELKIKLGSVITSEVEHWQEQLAVLQGKLALASRPADVRIAEFMEASKGFLGNVRAQYETEMQGLRTQRAEAEAEGAHKGRMQEIKAEMAKLGDGSVKVKVYMRLSETERQADKLKSEVSGNLPAVLDHVYHQGETYTTSYKMIDQVSEGQYGDMVGDFASENIIKKAIEKAQQIGKVGNEDAAGVKQALFRNFADVMLARGAGRHQIRRSEYLIQGYDQENTTQIYRDYMTGAAGMLSKAMYAKQQFDNYRYAPADVKPWAEKYIKDTLRNMGHTDRIGGNVRALATFMYLGFKVSSILINGTQAWTLGVAELGRRTKQNSVKAIGKAQLDILKSRLSKEEEDIFNNQLWKEQEMATAIHEMSGAGEGATGKASKFMHTLVGKSLLPFQEMEMMNRRTMVLASYRSFLADGMSKTDALAEAMDVNRKTNFEMSRANLPGFAHKPVGRTVYALQSFVWNNWNWIYNRATSGEKADILALLKYAGMITAIGGVAALAGGDEINKLIRRLTGKDHRMAMEVWTRKHAKEYGTAGELMNAAVWHGGMGALGVNVSNAMRLNIPMSGWITGDSTAGESAMGIWSGMYDKGANTLKYASRGQIGRALESAAPAAIEAPIKAYRMATQGATTTHGKPVFDENGKPLKYSGLDAAKRAIGLQPAEQSFRSEVSQSLVKTKAYWSEQRGTLLDSLRVAGNQGDRKSVMKDILKFNKDVRKSQAWPLVGAISSDTIRRSQAASKPDRKKQQWMRKNIE